MKKMFLLIGCACLAGWFMWSEGLTHVSPVPEAPVVAEVEQPEYMVYITGAVRKPGLYSFPDVVTIGDAVHAAGDALPYAEASAVNYAARIEDGMQIHLPYNLDGVPAASESDGQININDADETKLTELPGIGPAMARHIIEYRDKHGGFTDCEQLQQVKGIGTAKFEKLKDKVTV